MQEQLRSPAFLLASFLSNRTGIPELVLVTGRSGCGKTTWCLGLVEQARQAGISPLGMLSPAVFVDGCKVAIDLLEIHTGERRRLAHRRPEGTAEGGPGPHTRAWQFNAGVLDWANRSLDDLPAGDVLILDELGPLELLKSQGLVSGLKLVDERRYRMICVAVRPLLLAAVLERWPWAVVLELSN